MAFHINSMKLSCEIPSAHNTQFGTSIIPYNKPPCPRPSTYAVNAPGKLKSLSAARAGDVRHSLTNITAAQEQPGCHSITDFHKGMRHTATCYQTCLT